jgi:hypothetical protein
MAIRNQMEDINKELAKRRAKINNTLINKSLGIPLTKIPEKISSDNQTTSKAIRKFDLIGKLPKFPRFISGLESLKMSSARYIRPQTVTDELKDIKISQDDIIPAATKDFFLRPYNNSLKPELQMLIKVTAKHSEKNSAQGHHHKSSSNDTNAILSSQASSGNKLYSFIPNESCKYSVFSSNDSGFSSRVSTAHQGIRGPSRGGQPKGIIAPHLHRRVNSQEIGRNETMIGK